MDHVGAQTAEHGDPLVPRPWLGRLFRWRPLVADGSLLLRFSLLSLAVLAIIALSLGWVMQRAMEHDALVQQADEVAAVIDGILGRHLTLANVVNAQQPAERARWEGLAHTLLQADSHLVRLKVWDTHGRVVYSNNPQQIGHAFPLDASLRVALTGQRMMDVSYLSGAENVGDRAGHSALLESYLPMRAGGRVIGAYEAYSDLATLEHQLNDARRTIWATIALGFVVLYASLFAIVYQAARRLARQVREISVLGAQAREAETLRQVDRLKDDFIGTVSHELRRPLASIKGYTASLLLPEAQWDASVQREFLEVIDTESDHLTALIDNLLDLARLGSGSLDLVREPVYLPALIAQAVRRMRVQAQLPAHPYEVRFPAHFPTIEADSARITQVVLNLLENAAKYAPAGTPIVVEGDTDGVTVALHVRDRGPGLTPEQAARVFDKFYRVESGLTRATEGTGLGLAISRGVVEAHGGHIGVLSDPGQGCTFTVQLPVLAAAPLGVSAAVPASHEERLHTTGSQLERAAP